MTIYQTLQKKAQEMKAYNLRQAFEKDENRFENLYFLFDPLSLEEVLVYKIKDESNFITGYLLL